MSSPTPSPPRGSGVWSWFSRAFGGPRGLGRGEFTLFGLLALAIFAGVGFVVAPQLFDSPGPGPGWAKPEKLPRAKPVWTEEASAAFALIHDDVLLSFDPQGGDSPDVYDLATGRKLMSDRAADQSWISGDSVVVFSDMGSEKATVYDIHTGEVSRTIEFGGLAQVAVSSGMLVVVEKGSEDETRLRGVDVSTGKEEWTRKLEKSWADYNLVAPSPLPSDGRLDRYGFSPESASPVAFLVHRSDSEDAAEPVDAIDVSTGEKKWGVPGDGGASDVPVTDASQLTAGGQIFTRGTDGSDSYIVDAESGEATEYPNPPVDLVDRWESPLHGDRLLTADGGRLAIADITTGEIVWRSKHTGDTVAVDGGVSFESVVYEPEDAGEPEVHGTRAVDTETGKTLWTREDFGGTRTSVAGDVVVTTGYRDSDDERVPTRVYDRDTGEGLFQLAPGAGQLLTHNDEYLVFLVGNSEEDLELSVVSRADPLG